MKGKAALHVPDLITTTTSALLVSQGNCRPLLLNQSGALSLVEIVEILCSDWLIYHLVCKGCGVEYVGKTDRPIHSRMTQHRNYKGKEPSAMAVHQRKGINIPICFVSKKRVT